MCQSIETNYGMLPGYDLGCSVAWFNVECFNQLLKPISSYVGPDTNYYLQTFYPLIPIIKWSIANVGSEQRRNISLFLLENQNN